MALENSPEVRLCRVQTPASFHAIQPPALDHQLWGASFKGPPASHSRIPEKLGAGCRLGEFLESSGKEV